LANCRPFSISGIEKTRYGSPCQAVPSQSAISPIRAGQLPSSRTVRTVSVSRSSTADAAMTGAWWRSGTDRPGAIRRAGRCARPRAGPFALRHTPTHTKNGASHAGGRQCDQLRDGVDLRARICKSTPWVLR
jgi:hypothetical protein